MENKLDLVGYSKETVEEIVKTLEGFGYRFSGSYYGNPCYYDGKNGATLCVVVRPLPESVR